MSPFEMPPAAYVGAPATATVGLQPMISFSILPPRFRKGLAREVVSLDVTLRDVTIDNFSECVALRVSDAQWNMVAPNVYSLAQAKVQPECVPLAIYAGDTQVGFLMYALDRCDGNFWIYRLMVDERYQRKGFGRAALGKAIDRLGREPGCTRIMISLEPDNRIARRLYKEFGFVETGERIHGEDVLSLHLSA